MNHREIRGPQDRFEQKSGATYRDVRPTTQKFGDELKSSFSGVVLVCTAGMTWWWPALVDFTLPGSILYATWVLTRRPRLPLHLPLRARCKDANNPDPKNRRPRRSAGAILIGHDTLTGQELWISIEAARQHGTIPGTTGAGKTATILSMLANALGHGSGFILVDGKADNRLYADALALARRFGREDDVLALSFLVANDVKDSNTFNAFATGNADAIRELVLSQLGEQRSDDPNGYFRDNAVALITAVVPALTWMRDNHGVPVNLDRIRYSLGLRWIWTLAKHRVFLVRDPNSDSPHEYKVPEIPDDIIYPLDAYLGELPGYNSSIAWNQQKDSRPSEQHGYSVRYFSKTFAQLTISLGHIFKVQNGDIDMRDVVLNRRILIVNLPALENSDDTLAALGKIVVASIRGVLAQLVGARLDGPPDEIFPLRPTAGDAPFHICFDELAYYATGGLDRMLAMGRGFNVMFWLAFQEISGMWARIGEKTNTLLGNANLTIAMRQQDVSRTREWLEKTAGQATVTQAVSFEGGSTGNYREGRHADVRQVNRIDWLELQSLIEGEAVIMYGGRRIYARVFHAVVDSNRPIRRVKPLMLGTPLPFDDRDLGAPVREVAETVTAGHLIGAAGQRQPPDPPIEALVSSLREGFSEGVPPVECSRRAMAALLSVSRSLVDGVPQVGHPADEPPETDMSPFFREAVAEPRAAVSDPAQPRVPIDFQLLSMLMEIERRVSSSPEAARRNAYAFLGERDFALQEAEASAQPDVSVPDLLERIEAVRSALRPPADRQVERVA